MGGSIRAEKITIHNFSLSLLAIHLLTKVPTTRAMTTIDNMVEMVKTRPRSIIKFLNIKITQSQQKTAAAKNLSRRITFPCGTTVGVHKTPKSSTRFKNSPMKSTSEVLKELEELKEKHKEELKAVRQQGFDAAKKHREIKADLHNEIVLLKAQVAALTSRLEKKVEAEKDLVAEEAEDYLATLEAEKAEVGQKRRRENGGDIA